MNEQKNMFIDNPNCAMFSAPGKCIALTDVWNQKPITCKRCSFYKTKHDLDKGRRKARQRLLSLPSDRLNNLLETYYSTKGCRANNGED